jgi:hypothetical protein
LVAAKKHIDPAMKLIPQWWGVMEISGDNDFKLIRKAKQNPEQDIEGIAELFSKTEIEDILSSADALKGFRGKSLLVLRSRILELYKKKQLKVQLCEMLKVRYQNHLSSQTLCGVE